VPETDVSGVYEIRAPIEGTPPNELYTGNRGLSPSDFRCMITAVACLTLRRCSGPDDRCTL
jgi:hypothetical protein